MLKVEEQRHLCILKLLQFFSTKQELGASNTDGTHAKQWLDRNKLKRLKALVFAKFSVKSSEEKRKFGVLLKARLISNRLANYWLSRQINFITIFFYIVRSISCNIKSGSSHDLYPIHTTKTCFVKFVFTWMKIINGELKNLIFQRIQVLANLHFRCPKYK